MNWNATVLMNHLFYLVLGAASMVNEIAPDLLPVVPPKYKHYVTGALVIAMWIKGHQNLFKVPPPPPTQLPPAKAS